MFSKREGILIYFYADSFDRVTYINTVNKSFLVWYLRRPILPRGRYATLDFYLVPKCCLFQ